jgi:hypothetical protein
MKDYPRMTRDDVKDLKRTAEDLNAVAAALSQGSWSAKAPCLAAIARAYEVVAGLYNRGEPYLLRGMKPRSRLDRRRIATPEELAAAQPPSFEEPQGKAG